MKASYLSMTIGFVVVIGSLLVGYKILNDNGFLLISLILVGMDLVCLGAIADRYEERKRRRRKRVNDEENEYSID